jgi:glucose/arabinose dehydrogenase
MRLAVFLMTVALAADAYAADEPPLTGNDAYGDWTKDAPGVHRLITSSDLQEPNATPSASNSPKVVPRPADAALHAPPGFTVAAFLSGLKDPRQMKMAPNGDIFVAESGGLAVRVIRTAPGAEKAQGSIVFIDHLPERPYGLAFYPPGNDPKYLYVATEGHVLRYPYRTGDLQARGPAETIVPDLPIGHHWTRDITFTPDGGKLLVAVGSASNDGEEGMEQEQWRANVLEYNPDGSGKRVFASGLRNPVTLAFNPDTNDLWATVNERDAMGDNLPPDYAAHVVDGGFYGWPWYYIGAHQDKEHAGQHPELKNKVRAPEVLLQPHSAPLGCAFYSGTQFPDDYKGDLFIALHGSWNRAKRTGYKIARASFKGGKPTGEYIDFVTGFVTPEGDVWGRPVGVVMAQDGSLLFSDDAGGTIWRVAYGK